MFFHLFCLKTVIFFGGILEFAASYTTTVARVGQSVNMTWSISQSVTDFKIKSNTQQKSNRTGSIILFIVNGNTTLLATVDTHTDNGTRIRLTVNTSLEERKLVSLKFHSVDVQDAGVYNLNTHNSDVSPGTQLLIVLRKPSKPNITTTVADPVSGDPVNLTCSTTSRSLPTDQSLNTSYTWRRNNRSVDSRVDNRVQVDGQFLTVDHVTKEDKGVYSCQSGEEGLLSDWSQGYTLNVLYGPDQIQFDGTRDKLQVEEGKPVTVRCSADCNPACSVTWWDTSRQVVITGHREAVLSIPVVDVSVSGQYTCHVNNSHGSASRNLILEVITRELNESGVVSMVPVAAVCLVLIVVIAVVVIVLVCRKHRLRGRGYILNRIVTYTRDPGADGGYQEIEETGYADYRLVLYHREDENDGSYQEIEGGDVNVDDIVPIVAVYSVMLTAVAVVVAAVTVLVCKDVKEDQGRRCGDYLTVMAERLSHDFSDVPRASNNDVLPLHDYKRVLREQFHIYTSLHPQSFSTEDHNGRQRVYRCRNERYADPFVVERNRYGGGSLMVWSGITARNRTALVIIDGNLNATRYRDKVLAPVDVPFLQHHGPGVILQQDNTRPKTARAVQQYLQQQQVDVLLWPDISPTEHVWDEMKRQLLRLPHAPSTLVELQRQLIRIWNNIPQHSHANLFASMRRSRCTAVVDADGSHTRY
ncbi:uncharacterized protein [Haliotis asinina]|uniref:uncharacterized protein n=1 Tax=Haliotis asinina TaxID=109174 RepID=UPI00353191AA